MPDDHTPPDGEHWLVRHSTIRLLWRAGIGVLALTVLADLVVTHHPHFGFDGTLGFGAGYGFAACIALVLLAKAIGVFLKRPDTYYDH